MPTLYESNNCLYTNTNSHVAKGVGLKLHDCGTSPGHILLKTRMFVSSVCCVLCRWQPPRQVDHLFRGVTPHVCVYM